MMEARRSQPLGGTTAGLLLFFSSFLFLLGSVFSFEVSMMMPEEADKVVFGIPIPQPTVHLYDSVVFIQIADKKPDEYYFCGGSLIASQWVLTAAHCLFGVKNASSVKVGMGHVSLKNFTNDNVFDVDNFIIHPDHKPKFNDFATLKNDIALAHIDRPAPYLPVVLMDKATEMRAVIPGDTKLRVIGRGEELPQPIHSMHNKGQNSTPTTGVVDTLVYADEDVVPNNQCGRMLAKANNGTDPVSDSQICVMDPISHRGACQGDSGGPLVTVYNFLPYQVGIVSYGFGCGQPNQPNIYTRVSSFVPWILQTIGFTVNATVNATVPNNASRTLRGLSPVWR